MSEEMTVEDLEPEAACYYDRLGLDPRVDDPATKAESVYHDANMLKKEGDLSAKQFTQIREARDLLRNDEEREPYDAFLERFGRDAGTEAFHTWDDQGRPSSPGSWTPPSQSADDGPESGRTSETDEGDQERRRTRDGTDTGRTPDPERRQQRQQARQGERQSGRDRQTTTTRDSGARTSERQSRDSRDEAVSGRQRSEQRQQSRTDQRDDASGGSGAVEAATATKYRLGYLVCTVGVLATFGLLVAIAVDVVTLGNEVGAVGLLYTATIIGLSYVTRKWTDSVEDTSDPGDVYDSVLLRPGLVKRAALVGIGLAVLQSLLDGAVPQLVLQAIGVVSLVGVLLLPTAFSFTQLYDVTLANVAN